MVGRSDFYTENILVQGTKMPKENCRVVVLVFFVENGLVLIRSSILVPAPPPVVDYTILVVKVKWT